MAAARTRAWPSPIARSSSSSRCSDGVRCRQPAAAMRSSGLSRDSAWMMATSISGVIVSCHRCRPRRARTRVASAGSASRLAKACRYPARSICLSWSESRARSGMISMDARRAVLSAANRACHAASACLRLLSSAENFRAACMAMDCRRKLLLPSSPVAAVIVPVSP